MYLDVSVDWPGTYPARDLNVAIFVELHSFTAASSVLANSHLLQLLMAFLLHLLVRIRQYLQNGADHGHDV